MENFLFLAYLQLNCRSEVGRLTLRTLPCVVLWDSDLAWPSDISLDSSIINEIEQFDVGPFKMSVKFSESVLEVRIKKLRMPL